MANTYTQVYIHFVFVVKYRNAVIHPNWKDELLSVITSMIQNEGHKVIAINSMPDHVHLFCGMSPTQSFSDFMRNVKSFSSKWINDKGLTEQVFRWQTGYAAFSYSKSKIPIVANYIANQEKHHAKKTFQEEYIKCLKDFGIDFDERYIFQVPE